MCDSWGHTSVMTLFQRALSLLFSTLRYKWVFFFQSAFPCSSLFEMGVCFLSVNWSIVSYNAVLWIWEPHVVSAMSFTLWWWRILEGGGEGGNSSWTEWEDIIGNCNHWWDSENPKFIFFISVNLWKDILHRAPRPRIKFPGALSLFLLYCWDKLGLKWVA